MFKKSTILAAAAVGLVGLGSSVAQAAAPTADEARWELTLGGSGGNDKDFNDGNVNIDVSVGYYFTDQLELSVRQNIGYNDDWSAATRLALDYHFSFGQDQPVVPFVGIELGYLYGDDTGDTWAAGPEAGLKFYVNDTTFIFGQVAYQFFFEDSDDADDAFEDGSFVYSLGIGFRF